MEFNDNILNEDFSTDDISKLNLSNTYKCIKGGFETEGVETYLSTATVKDLIEDIEVFEKLTKDRSWPVSTIIQREIDDNRVREIAEEYILVQKNNVKYFPPLIIALIPRNENEEINPNFPEKTYTTDEVKVKIHEKGNYHEKLLNKFKDSNDISNLEGLYIIDWFQDLAKFPLTWDKQKLYAVAIDGQHRLMALQQARKSNSNVNNYLQDVVFLDVSKKSKIEGRTPVEAIRRIFIDINYNAKPVSAARRTLMDDKDLSSLIVQSLVNDDDQDGKRKGKYITPQLLDWHSDHLKYQLPYLSGVLTLQQLVEDVILDGNNLVKLSDFRTLKKVEQFISQLNSRFDIDSQIDEKTKYENITKLNDSYREYKSKIDETETETEEDDKEDILFSLDYNTLNIARDQFETIYASSIVKFFKEFLPYECAIKVLNENYVFNPEHRISRIIIKNPKKLHKDEKKKLKELTEELESQLKDSCYLFFTVLGQKVFFSHYWKYLISNIDGDYTEQSVLNITNEWLKAINVIISDIINCKYSLFGSEHNDKMHGVTIKGLSSHGSLTNNFWQGVIYNETSIIYNTQGIKAFLSVLDYIFEIYRINEFDIVNAEKITFPSDKTWSEIKNVKPRIRRKILNGGEVTNPEEAEHIAEKIWELKKKFLHKYIADLSK